jgi:hypothetical protein
MSFWRTEAGQAAIERFDVWAQVVRLRENGGLALPSKSGAGGGGIAEPSMGTAFFKADDVDATLKAWDCTWTGMERLLRYMYVDGSEEVVIGSDFLLYGGDVVSMNIEDIKLTGEPGRYSAKHDRYAFRRVYDLANYSDVYIDKFAQWLLPDVVGSLGERRRMILLNLHEAFAKTMISFRGVGAGMPRIPDRAPRSAAAFEQEAPMHYADASSQEIADGRKALIAISSAINVDGVV